MTTPPDEPSIIAHRREGQDVPIEVHLNDVEDIQDIALERAGYVVNEVCSVLSEEPDQKYGEL